MVEFDDKYSRHFFLCYGILVIVSIKKEERTVIRARISEVIGDYALLEIEGIMKVVSLNELPAEARKGDLILYHSKRLMSLNIT